MGRQMKDSGIEWIGQIPEEWDIIKTKNVFTNHKDIVGDKENEYERLSLTLNGVLKRPKDDNKGLQSESISTYQILNEKELVFKMIDLENLNTSRVGYSPYTGLVSPVYIILKNENYSKFGYYYFYSMWQRAIFNQMGNNGVRSALNAKDMLMLPFPKLSVIEANKIADFLDEKVREIDKVIETTKVTIEDYKKYKQSVITEAVTKGLNPDVEMKDSGIEWIGEIPEHWKLIKFKHVADFIGKGNGITKEDIVENGDTECVRYGEIYTKYNYYFNECYTKTDKDKISSLVYFSYGDLLFAGTGELIEEIGKNIVYLGNEQCLTGGDIVLAKHAQNPLFMSFALNSNYAQTQKSCGKSKLKVVHISASEIGNIIMALPPSDEQEKIAKMLKDKNEEIDNIISIKEKLIEDMESYKKSLIYEYVTGKKEVSDNE